VSGATWGRDGTIVFAWFDLFRVPATGGTPTVLLKVDEQRGQRFYRHPSFLPSGHEVLFTIGKADTQSYDDADIAVVSLENPGQPKVLVEGGTSPHFTLATASCSPYGSIPTSSRSRGRRSKCSTAYS
jgi:hypothetical protein